VLLTSGLDEAAVKALHDGPGRAGGDHLHKLLKFVTLRMEKGASRSGIQAPGGPVDPAVDGDPAECAWPAPLDGTSADIGCSRQPLCQEMALGQMKKGGGWDDVPVTPCTATGKTGSTSQLAPPYGMRY
jgi:hypothetical protein